MSNAFTMEVTEVTFAPQSWPLDALPGPQPDFVRVPNMKMVGFAVRTIQLPVGYNPHLRLTIDYGVPIRVVDDNTHVRRRETSSFLTYTRLRYVEPEAALTAVVQ